MVKPVSRSVDAVVQSAANRERRSHSRPKHGSTPPPPTPTAPSTARRRNRWSARQWILGGGPSSVTRRGRRRGTLPSPTERRGGAVPSHSLPSWRRCTASSSGGNCCATLSFLPHKKNRSPSGWLAVCAFLFVVAGAERTRGPAHYRHPRRDRRLPVAGPLLILMCWAIHKVVGDIFAELTVATTPVPSPHEIAWQLEQEGPACHPHRGGRGPPDAQQPSPRGDAQRRDRSRSPLPDPPRPPWKVSVTHDIDTQAVRLVYGILDENLVLLPVAVATAVAEDLKDPCPDGPTATPGGFEPARI